MRHRLRVAGSTTEIFSRAALREIYRLSGGVPRVINIICDRALLGAYTEDHHHVSSAMVRRAASEIFGERLAPPWLIPLVATVCVLVALTVGSVLWRQASKTRALAAVAAAHRAPPAAAQLSGPIRPAPAPSLAQLFASAGSSTSADTAFGTLFQLWNAHYQAGPTDPCTQAESQGLYCVTLHSSLAQLREFARPALLMLGEGGVASHQVVMTGLGADSVILQMGTRIVRVPIADLSTYWFGDCVLLWHPATPPVPELRPGMHGPAVRSLRVQLLRASGLTPNGPQSATYEVTLSRLVEDFQREHHLTVDGIAGIETQLILDGALAAPGTPLLQALPAEASAKPG